MEITRATIEVISGPSDMLFNGARVACQHASCNRERIHKHRDVYTVDLWHIAISETTLTPCHYAPV